MALTLAVVQALAPDQGSLSAAGKLLQPKHWLRAAQSASLGVMWGECQGSGANPYLVVADANDHGYKCSCPSRKFPCKHSLALLWQFAEWPDRFAEQEVPQWVHEWMGRRRRSGGAPAAAGGGADKSLEAARMAATEPATALSEEYLEKRQKAAERRRAQADEVLRAGLGELEQWLRDQLRGGIGAFVEDAPTRCRRIAARLVDAKATGLASRLDELPSRLLALPREARGEAAVFELGQITLLMRAWLAEPDDIDARCMLQQPPTREAVIGDAEALRVAGTWEVVGCRAQTRRDGLVAQSTWLMHTAPGAARFALLLDHFPATAGRRSAAFELGQSFHAEIAYYPSRYPLRAVLAGSQAESVEHAPAPPTPATDPLSHHRAHLSCLPWAQQTPLLLAEGQLLRSGGQLWWQSTSGQALPVASVSDDALWCGSEIRSAVALWDGHQATLLKFDTALGVAYPND